MGKECGVWGNKNGEEMASGETKPNGTMVLFPGPSQVDLGGGKGIGGGLETFELLGENKKDVE